MSSLKRKVVSSTLLPIILVVACLVSESLAYVYFTYAKRLAPHQSLSRTQKILHMADGEEQALEEVQYPYSCPLLSFPNICIQRLKSALWFSIGKIVDEETLKLGVNATPQFIGALTEMVWAQIGRLQFPLTVTHFAHADIDPQ